MDTTQRVNYLEMYRSKVQNELDLMHYGRVRNELPAATVPAPQRPLGAWAVAVTILLVAGMVFGQAL